MFNFLDREHSAAGPGYSRWLVPPAVPRACLAVLLFAVILISNPRWN
jgi:hypothetical protein